MRGTPLRLKSTPLFSADHGKPSCSSLPASSSMWMRCEPHAAEGARRPGSRRSRRWPAAGRTARSGSPWGGPGRSSSCARRPSVSWTVQCVARAARRARADGLAVQHGQRAGQAQADGADVGVGLVAEAVAAGAEDLGRGQELDVDLEADDRSRTSTRSRRPSPSRSPRPAILHRIPLDAADRGPLKVVCEQPPTTGPAARILRRVPGLRPLLRAVPRPASGPRAAAPGPARRRALRLPVHRLRVVGRLAQGHGRASGPRPGLIAAPTSSSQHLERSGAPAPGG